MSKARVFLSCGQAKSTDEPEIARRIRDKLETCGFECYVAVDDQSALGLRENIFHQLSAADYFILVDFRRDKMDNGIYRGSLFSNQELAIASFIETPLMVYQEDGLKPLDGMLGAIQGNASVFYDRTKLPDRVLEDVQRKLKNGDWTISTRNQLALQTSIPPFSDANAVYPGGRLHPRRHFHVAVNNLHHRKAALGCYAYIEKIRDIQNCGLLPTKTIEFKWAGTPLPSVRIAPASSRLFDAFHVRHDLPSVIEFNAITDSTDYLPKIPGTGEYEVTYAVASENFAISRATFRLRVGSQISELSFETV